MEGLRKQSRQESSSVIYREGQEVQQRGLEMMAQLQELKQNVQMEGTKKRTKVKDVMCLSEIVEGKECEKCGSLPAR